MRKIKRLVALLTVAAFMFSFAAPGFAADATTTKTAVVGTDVKGTKYENDAFKLISLGIVKGYPDGTVKPDATVTRAEFAAIVANELGMADGVVQSATKFKDVPASYWGSGVINLAVGRGIIVGYPDGSFKPDAPVTYAEAYAMLVQMLGYGPALKGAAWPSGVLAKAASLGVSKGVTGGATVAMKRGDVIKAAANSLDVDLMEQTTYGDDNNYGERDGETILTEVFDIAIVDDGTDEVTDVPMVNMSGLESDEVEIESNIYTISPVYNANEFLGQKVEYWVNDDDEIFYLGAADDQKVINDTIDDVSVGRIYLDDADDDYAIDVAAKIWTNIDADGVYNAAGFTDADLDLLTDANVKVVIEDDEVVAAVITDFSAGTVGVAEEVNTSDETIDMYSGAGSTVDLDGYDYVVVKDGLNASLADIEASDVVNVLVDEPNEEKYVAVTSTKVEGTADISWKGDDTQIVNYTVTVDDEDYDVDDDAKYSDDANDSINGLDDSDLKDLNGEEVTLYLDAKGDIAHIVSGSVEGSADNYAIISKSAVYSGGFDDEVKFNMVNTEGTETTYQFDPADVDLNGAEEEPTANDDLIVNGGDGDGVNWETTLSLSGDADHFIAVEYKLNSAGELTKVDVLGDDFSDVAEVLDIDANEDDKTISLGTGDFKITDKTVIMDVTEVAAGDDEYDDIDKVTWDAIDNKTNMTGYVQTDGSEVDYLFITSATGSLTSDKLYGVVKSFTTVGGDDAVKLLLPDGTIKTIVSESATIDAVVYNRNLAKGDFIAYELDADEEMDNYTILAFDNSAATFANAAELAQHALDYANAGLADDFSSGESIKVGGTLYSINDSTKIYEVFDTGALKLVSSISDGDRVLIIDTDDDNRTADYIVVLTDN